MRTTVDLTPEAYHVAQIVARERKLSLGKVISEFILRRDPSEMNPSRSAAGFPVFSSGKIVTSADVRSLLDED